MNSPLLQTKLYAPPLRPELVSRPRLIERLNAGLDRKLTLISAPAGFGKTTLLSEWVSGWEQPVAWVSLDEGDNDPSRFLAYLIAALQTIEANIGKETLGALQSPQPPPAESVLTVLINEMAAVFQGDPCGRPYSRPNVLVLDDYQVIEAQPVHRALIFLLDHLPLQMHLVIATRSDPPLPLARLRGRGQLSQVHLADLRFTPDKAAEFLNQAMGLGLSADNVAALVSRTEGWIAGLQMAAVSMQGREDATGFIQAFTGSNRYVLDYLVEEVLQRQSENIQTFLFQTAILDRLTGSLCDAVTGREDGQSTLERLERANLFIMPLDNERRWYRYHRLFAELLRQRLGQALSRGTQPDLVPTLYRRASEWFERHGLAAGAIAYALSARDFERAARLIEGAAEAILMRSEVATFLNWVDALPDEVVRSRSSLCIFHAWAMLLAGRPVEAVKSRLQDADRGADRIPAKAAALRAMVATFQGQMPRATELSRQALEQLPREDLFLRGVATWNLGVSYSVGGDIAAAGQAFDRAARIGQETGNVMIAVVALCNLAELRMAEGQLGEARGLYERALAFAVDKEGRPMPIAGIALMGLGELQREWNDLEAAMRHLTKGIELTRQWVEIGSLDGYIALARVKQAQGDADGARDAIQKAWRVAIKFDATELDDILVAAYQTQLWLAQGNLEAAMHWVEKRGLEGDAGSSRLDSQESRTPSLYYLRDLEHVMLARVWIAQGRTGEALVLLELPLSVAERQRLNGSVIKIQVVKALALHVQGDTPLAMDALEWALTLAEPEGYVRVFVDEGEPMARLLRQAASRGIAPEYVSKLLSAFDKSEACTHVPPQPLIDPLSERELEVLWLLRTSLSSVEIAEELAISVHTVRSHIKHIYDKLNVHGRMEAVHQAGALKLL
jgi:LuxR family maltose regulon positive regulatory protein